MRHRLVWFVVGVSVALFGRVALGEKPREAPKVLKIKVVDAVTGKAMGGVSLRYVGYLSGDTFTETTSLGDGGTTALAWSKVSKYYLTFSFRIGKRSLHINRTVKATDANAASLILRIPTGRYKKPLIVTVLDAETGKPVPRASIHAAFLDPGGDGFTAHQVAETSAKGEAAIHWSGEGKHRIWCTKIDGRELTKFYVRMELTDGIWKAGKLTWKIKVPKLSARVKVFLLSRGKKTAAPDGVAFGARIVEKDKTGMTTREVEAVCKDGKVEFHGLEVGAVTTFGVLTGAREHNYVPLDVKPWTFKGKVLDLEATLVSAGEYRAKLTVRVLDEKGRPVEGATVELGGAGSGKGVTNSAGLTAWSGLRVGRYTVSARKEGYTPVGTRREISVPGADEVVIKLGQGRSATTRPTSRRRTGGRRRSRARAVQ